MHIFSFHLSVPARLSRRSRPAGSFYDDTEYILASRSRRPTGKSRCDRVAEKVDTRRGMPLCLSTRSPSSSWSFRLRLRWAASKNSFPTLSHPPPDPSSFPFVDLEADGNEDATVGLSVTKLVVGVALEEAWRWCRSKRSIHSGRTGGQRRGCTTASFAFAYCRRPAQPMQVEVERCFEGDELVGEADDELAGWVPVGLGRRGLGDGFDVEGRVLVVSYVEQRKG
ncbi:hypothetical protein HMN09_01233800 [Mycena chlorophos]|uniref:Uncharacterized protein n=1 Tax=Mycena chlorophos TaxID=658473 RepID=A0A8H6S3G9_MYCCL|nr:hypothetical protein HMN09_01233800 [Mycena chlorophos]